MKCIQKGGAVLRVSDKEAAIAVKEHGWNYVRKLVWKEQAR